MIKRSLSERDFDYIPFEPVDDDQNYPASTEVETVQAEEIATSEEQGESLSALLGELARALVTFGILTLTQRSNDLQRRKRRQNNFHRLRQHSQRAIENEYWRERKPRPGNCVRSSKKKVTVTVEIED